MSFYGRANRNLVEQAVYNGALKDAQIVECDLSGFQVVNTKWDHVDIRDLHANDIVFQNTKLEKNNFYRSGFMRASFADAVLDATILDGLTLIKSKWQNSEVHYSTLKNLCFQRSQFSRVRFISSSLVDFEALDIRMNNCIFAHSTISISYGSGMNGFSSAHITQCLFYHCRFEGFPLRGARIASSVFAHCSGQIGDDMDCVNVAGIGLQGKAQQRPLRTMNEARRLIDRISSRKQEGHYEA